MSTPIGPYAPVVRAGGFSITSGQLGVVAGPDGTPQLVAGRAGPQLRQALANGLALLHADGLSTSDVAKATVFLVDMEDFAEMNEVWIEVFAGHRPARSAVGVAALPMGARVEVELWAHRGGLG